MSPAADRRALAAALAIVVGFTAVEAIGGLLTHSLALLADAGHMLTDAAALALSVVAIQLAQRPASGRYTFGFRRAEIMAALANGVALGVLAGVVVAEAVHRLADPPRVEGFPVFAVAVLGAAANLAATWQVSRANRENLNVRASYLHLVSDLYAFAATAVAGLVIAFSGFTRADALASLLIAALMLRSSFSIVRSAVRVLFDAAPEGVDAPAIAAEVLRHPLVVNIHDLHVWEIASGMPALSAHVIVRSDEDCHQVRRELEATVVAEFGIEHTTLQVDHAHEHGVMQVGDLRSAPDRPPRS